MPEQMRSLVKASSVPRSTLLNCRLFPAPLGLLALGDVRTRVVAQRLSVSQVGGK